MTHFFMQSFSIGSPPTKLPDTILDIRSVYRGGKSIPGPAIEAAIEVNPTKFVASANNSTPLNVTSNVKCRTITALEVCMSMWFRTYFVLAFLL